MHKLMTATLIALFLFPASSIFAQEISGLKESGHSGKEVIYAEETEDDTVADQPRPKCDENMCRI